MIGKWRISVVVAAVSLAASSPVLAQSAEPFDWKMTPGLVAGSNGVLRYPDSPAGVPDRHVYRVELNVNDPLCRRGARYRWLVGKDEIGQSDQCSLVHDFPLAGQYEVTLEVRGGGDFRKETRKILVRDWLIVSLGDSVASGEGNPDLGRGRWQNDQCHRSSLAASAQAALTVEQEDDHTSVTFLHLACSGADIERGLIGPYPGIERGFPALDPQVEDLGLVATRRPIDAVMISVGANDIYFGPVARFCLTHIHCPDQRFDPDRPGRVAKRGTPTARDVVARRIARLPILYERLARELDGIVPPSRVFLTEYFDPTHDARGELCNRIGPPIVGITQDEARWAHNDVLGPLDREVQAAAGKHGWNAVTGIAQSFATHGYCAGRDSWIRTIGESLKFQAGVAGTLHPNAAGHRAIATFLSGELERTLLSRSPTSGQGGTLTGGGPGGGSGAGADLEPAAAVALGGTAGVAGLGWGFFRWRRRRRARTAPAAAPAPPQERPPTAPAAALAAPPPRRTQRSDVGALLLSAREWIHRRVDSVELLDDKTVRRRVSIDFTLPDKPKAGQLAPLCLLRKGPLVNFDLRDEHGGALPLLTAAQIGEATTKLLVAAAEAALGRPAPPEVEARCRDIAFADEPHGAIRFLAAELQPADVRSALAADATFRELATTLADNFIVLVPIEEPARRRVVKLSFDEPMRLKAGLRVRLGWLGLPISIYLPNLDGASSHHVDLKHTAGLEVIDSALVVRLPDGRAFEAERRRGAPSTGAHFYTSNHARGSSGFAFLQMRARREGIVRNAYAFAGFIAVALTAAWFALPGIATKASDIGPLLLALPAIPATYLASSGEHPIARRLLEGARVLLFAAGLWALIGAAALALNPTVLTLRWVLGILAILAWATVALLVATKLLPRVPEPSASAAGVD